MGELWVQGPQDACITYPKKKKKNIKWAMLGLSPGWSISWSYGCI